MISQETYIKREKAIDYSRFFSAASREHMKRDMALRLSSLVPCHSAEAKIPPFREKHVQALRQNPDALSQDGSFLVRREEYPFESIGAGTLPIFYLLNKDEICMNMHFNSKTLTDPKTPHAIQTQQRILPMKYEDIADLVATPIYRVSSILTGNIRQPLSAQGDSCYSPANNHIYQKPGFFFQIDQKSFPGELENKDYEAKGIPPVQAFFRFINKQSESKQFPLELKVWHQQNEQNICGETVYLGDLRLIAHNIVGIECRPKVTSGDERHAYDREYDPNLFGYSTADDVAHPITAFWKQVISVLALTYPRQYIIDPSLAEVITANSKRAPLSNRELNGRWTADREKCPVLWDVRDLLPRSKKAD
jgi:hypothetical protein